MRPWLLALVCSTGCVAASPDVGDTDTVADTDVAIVVPPDAQAMRFFLHGGSYADTVTSTRFVNAAHGGRIVTLGAIDPADPDLGEYDAWWVRLGASDAVTLNLTTPDEANADSAVAALADADAIYLRGGDLKGMIAAWGGTAVEAGLRDAVARGAPLGGSAAGAAFLGAQLPVPVGDGLESWQAVEDPASFTLSTGAVAAIAGAVIDTDLAYRARLGRLARFTQALAATNPAAQGVGLDGQTALLVWADGTAEVAGRGAVTLLRPDPAGGEALVLWHLTAGYTVDLARVDPVVVRPSEVQVVSPVALPDAWTSTTLFGEDAQADRAGAWTVTGVNDPDAWWDGALRVVPGGGRLPGLTVVPGLFGDALKVGARQAAMLFALASNPGSVVIGLDVGAGARVLDATITPRPAPVWVLDGRAIGQAGLQDVGWRNPAFEGARLTLASDPWSSAD